VSYVSPHDVARRPKRDARKYHERDGHLRLWVPGGMLRVHRRAVFVCLLVVLATLALAVSSLCLGDYALSVPEVVTAMFGDEGFTTTLVREWRLPRVIAAIVFGAALAASGALFQTLTRNPLGSPDIIGFASGSYTGAIVAITLIGTNTFSSTAGALIGGLGTAVVVYLLAWRGGVQGFRLIIVGIAVTAVLQAVNTYLLLLAQTEVAMAASIWGAGSISLVGWDELGVSSILLALLGAATAFTLPSLRQLELGDDAALAHGVRLEPMRLTVLAVGVALVAVVTAITGPIAFGALLLLAADFIAQHVLGGSVPVGVVTVVIGGAYLVALLIQEARKQL
jgi:iron complex transport system permease protein